MALCTLNHMKISGITTVVPPLEKCIDEDVDQYAGGATAIQRIKETIGVGRRRVADPSVTALDLCLYAAEALLDEFSIDRESIDAVICVTQTPDYLQPCNAAVIHGKMELPESCACFDVNMGCSGYVYGLWIAGSLVEQGMLKRVLLLAGDTISKCVNPRDKTVSPLFGDAGSATLIEYQEGATPSSFALNTDGSGYEALIIPAGGYRNPRNEENARAVEDSDGNWRSACDLHMKGGDVFNFTLREVSKAILGILSQAGIAKEEIDYFFLHQANRYILSNIAKRIKVPIEKVPCDVASRYGNQSSASIPCVMADSLGGDTGESLHVLLSGFGVGLSWASAVLILDPSVVLPVIDYPEVAVTL